VLRRRRAAGTTAAWRACVRPASAVATRSGAAGQGCTNRRSQVLLAAISGPVIRAVEKLNSAATKLRLKPPRLGGNGSASLLYLFLRPRYAGARNLQGAGKNLLHLLRIPTLEITRLERR
jgi:hypothetical protein